MTTSWTHFHTAQPGLAETVRNRFGGYKHHVLGTLRADGSPRLSGIEAEFRLGELWFGMMPGSRKALDLRRDPRFALHGNPVPDTSMDGGDVRISGRAVEVTDPAAVTRFTREVTVPEGPFHLFRADIAEVVRTYVEDEDLVLQVWRPGGPLRTIRRGSDESPPRTEV
ncbi:pyridoxamine 5'-phosphate oxidase family protein [Actinacidiphila sp. bgisy167]|uniref:pyridoxamine 5'-phosphate oxidase family protein n=1 Tax=Actinacidiphila sp. bgisy167 TaxID=3413797 RepID=UPI003D70EE62